MASITTKAVRLAGLSNSVLAHCTRVQHLAFQKKSVKCPLNPEVVALSCNPGNQEEVEAGGFEV